MTTIEDSLDDIAEQLSAYGNTRDRRGSRRGCGIKIEIPKWKRQLISLRTNQKKRQDAIRSDRK